MHRILPCFVEVVADNMALEMVAVLEMVVVLEMVAVLETMAVLDLVADTFSLTCFPCPGVIEEQIVFSG